MDARKGLVVVIGLSSRSQHRTFRGLGLTLSCMVIEIPAILQSTKSIARQISSISELAKPFAWFPGAADHDCRAGTADAFIDRIHKG